MPKVEPAAPVGDPLYRAMTLNWLPILYRRAGPKVKNTLAYFDPAVVPFPRDVFEPELGQLGSLIHQVKPEGIAGIDEFGGKGGLQVEVGRLDRRRELYGTAKPTPEHHLAGPPGRYGAVQSTPAWNGSARGTEPANDYDALPFELRMLALCLV